jgi:predicted Zn-dependent protease with MMP-like domain
MDPRDVPREAFEAMVVDAIDALPDWMAPILAEIAVLVEDEPAPGQVPAGTLLFGLYHGLPRTRRGGRVPGTLPDTITLFRRPIVAVCDSREAVHDRVLKVLGHEVGHAMGISESKLRSLGWH